MASSKDINPRYVDGEPVCSGTDCIHLRLDRSDPDWPIEDWSCELVPNQPICGTTEPCVPALCRDRDKAEARADAAEAMVESMRRELPQYDCRRTGGPVSDVAGKHCPVDDPCQRCRLEAAEAKLEAVREYLIRCEARCMSTVNYRHDNGLEIFGCSNCDRSRAEQGGTCNIGPLRAILDGAES